MWLLNNKPMDDFAKLTPKSDKVTTWKLQHIISMSLFWVVFDWLWLDTIDYHAMYKYICIYTYLYIYIHIYVCVWGSPPKECCFTNCSSLQLFVGRQEVDQVLQKDLENSLWSNAKGFTFQQRHPRLFSGHFQMKGSTPIFVYSVILENNMCCLFLCVLVARFYSGCSREHLKTEKFTDSLRMDFCQNVPIPSKNTHG